MKKTRKIRLLAFILTLCLTLGALPLYVFAEGTEAELPEQITETTNENLTAFQLGLGEKSVAELENMTLSAADIPASISRETVEAKDHVLRLREQEADLNTVIFQNRDGGKTVYLFGSPVKYVDANGNIRDKSTTLVSENVTVNGKTYAHSATDNFFGQYYPTMPQNGVMLAFGPYTVEMKPVITGVLTLRDTVVADNKVTYNKVFGTGTSLVYTPTLNGVKEDIILSAYTGKSSFSFTLKTNGLAIVQDENDTFLADFGGNKVASLGDVIITDKVGKTVYGTMTVVTKIEREEYTVTVNAPAAFLANPTTAYPVTVDPTVIIDEDDVFMDDYGNNLDIIHDMCIYQNCSVSSPISTIGSFFYNEDSCEMEESARMLYRLNPYYFSSSDSPLLYMSSPRFESASLFTTVALGQESPVTVNIHPYSAMWSYEENAYGENVYYNGTVSDYSSNPDYNAAVPSACSSTIVYYTEPMPTEFDITPIVNYWTSCDNDTAYEYGFIMRLPEEEGCIERLSVWQSEYSGTSVYIAIDYNNLSGSYYVNSCDTGKFLSCASTSSVAQSVYGSEDYQGWTFTYKGNNLYEIALTANPNRLLYMDSSYNVAIGSRSSLNSANYTWQLSFYYNYVTIRNQGTGKYLYAPGGGTTLSGTSSVSLAHWRMCKTSKYANLNYFRLSGSEWVDVNENLQLSIGTKSPASPTWCNLSDFSFTSSNTYDATVSSTGVITGTSDGYSKITATHKPTGCTASIIVTVGQIIDDGKYYITNKVNGLALSTSSDDIYVEQNNIGSSNRQRWKVTYIGNGYYYLDVILGEWRNEVFVLEANRLAFSNNLTNIFTSFVTSTSPCTGSIYKIRLLRVSNGGIKITSEYSESSKKVLAVADSVLGSNCTQSVYTANNTYFDEWVFEAHRDAFLLGVPDGPNDADTIFNEVDDRTYIYDDIVPYLRSATYTDIEICDGTYEGAQISATYFIDKMEKSSILTFFGHGTQSSINLGGGMAVDLSGLSDTQFIRTDLVVYCCCSTGSGGDPNDGVSYNFMEETQSKGVQTVVAFSSVMSGEGATMWFEKFIEAMCCGKSVLQSCEFADEKLYYEIEYGNLDSKTKANYQATVGRYSIAGDSGNTLFD